MDMLSVKESLHISILSEVFHSKNSFKLIDTKKGQMEFSIVLSYLMGDQQNQFISVG